MDSLPPCPAALPFQARRTAPERPIRPLPGDTWAPGPSWRPFITSKACRSLVPYRSEHAGTSVRTPHYSKLTSDIIAFEMVTHHELSRKFITYHKLSVHIGAYGDSPWFKGHADTFESRAVAGIADAIPGQVHPRRLEQGGIPPCRSAFQPGFPVPGRRSAETQWPWGFGVFLCFPGISWNKMEFHVYIK